MSASKLRSRRGTGQKTPEHDEGGVGKKEKAGRTRSVLKLVDSVDDDLKGRSPKLKVSEHVQNNGQDANTARLPEVDQRPSKSIKQKTPKKDDRKSTREDSSLIRDRKSSERGNNPDIEGNSVNPVSSRRRTRSSGVINQSEDSPSNSPQTKTHKKSERQSNLVTTTNTKNIVEPVSLDIVTTPPSASKDLADAVQKSSRLTQIEKTVEALHTYAKDNSVDLSQADLEKSRLDEAARIPKRGRPPKNVKQLQQKSSFSDQDILNKTTIKIKTEPLSPQRTSPRRAKTPVKGVNLEQSGNPESTPDEDPKNDLPINKPNTEDLLSVVSTRSSPRKRTASGSKEPECNDTKPSGETLEPLNKRQCKASVAKDLNKVFDDNTTSTVNNAKSSVKEEQLNNERNLVQNSKQNIPEVTAESSIGAKASNELLEPTFSNSRRSRRLSGREPEVEQTDSKNQTEGDDESTESKSIEGGLKSKSMGNVQGTSVEAKDEEEGDDRVFEEDVIGYEALSWYQDGPVESEPFYFESDHTALKGNKDYRMLLRTLATLEAQRQQSIRNLGKLAECQKDALSDPVEFVENLQNKVNIDLPVAQRVVAIPNINWEKYINKLEGTELLKFATEARNTRAAASKSSSASPSVDIPSTSRDAMSNSIVSIKKEEETVRGRALDANKTASFNQLWTIEEQRRLEECLVNYPQEEVEARRWEKVANALGNRTPQQVASRVQKYFIKLSKAGLPVPGRIPNLNMYLHKKTNRRMHHFTRPLLHQNSTFMQAYKPPVYMPDEDDNDLSNFNNSFEEEKSLLDESIPTELRDTEEYQELLRLTKLKTEMLEKDQGEHLGFKCDKCGCEPITGTRWHCKDCPRQVSVDLCPLCVDSKFLTDSHTVTHRMEPIEPANPNRHFEDKDYTSFTIGLWDYNYLDPNYNPANL